jgi:hypothetical protein
VSESKVIRAACSPKQEEVTVRCYIMGNLVFKRDHPVLSALRVVTNRVLRRISERKRDEVTEEWRKIHNGELHNL